MSQLRPEKPVVLTLHAEPTRILRPVDSHSTSPWEIHKERSGHDFLADRKSWQHKRLLLLNGRDSAALRNNPFTRCASVGHFSRFLDEGRSIRQRRWGSFGQWVQAGLEAQQRLINGPAGSIGSAIPMGLAAKLAHPQRPVFVFLGDGTFGYHAMEFDTALRYNLPIIAVVRERRALECRVSVCRFRIMGKNARSVVSCLPSPLRQSD